MRQECAACQDYRCDAPEALQLLRVHPVQKFVKQINHSPEMTSFFNIYLKQIPQIIKTWRSVSEQSLLFYTCWFGIALSHNDSAKPIPEFTRNFSPYWLDLQNLRNGFCLHCSDLVQEKFPNDNQAFSHNQNVPNRKVQLKLPFEDKSDLFENRSVPFPSTISSNRAATFLTHAANAILTEVYIIRNFFSLIYLHIKLQQ